MYHMKIDHIQKIRSGAHCVTKLAGSSTHCRHAGSIIDRAAAWLSAWIAPVTLPVPIIVAASSGSDHEPPAPSRDDGAEDAMPPSPSGSETPSPPPASDSSRVEEDDVADGQWKRLERSWITVTRIGIMIQLAIIGGLTLIGLLAALYFGWLSGGWRWLGVAGWAVLNGWLFWMVVWYPPMAYRHARYKITPRDVEIHWGVFWRQVINVSHSRVQHTDVTQGPIERRFGLGTLLIHTAGTQSHTVDLPGLSHERALRIRDFLLDYRVDEAATKDTDRADSSAQGPRPDEDGPTHGAEGSQPDAERA